METKTNYLAKLLTLLVKRSSNIIRIPIQDLMVDDIGQGFQVYFDQEAKELVLSHVPAGSTIYKIEGATTWLNMNQSSPLPLPSASKPLSTEDLVARVWTETGATQTTEELRRPLKNKVVTLTTEGMAEAESERRRQQALREIESYSSPQPPSRPQRERQVFIKP